MHWQLGMHRPSTSHKHDGQDHDTPTCQYHIPSHPPDGTDIRELVLERLVHGGDFLNGFPGLDQGRFGNSHSAIPVVVQTTSTFFDWYPAI